MLPLLCWNFWYYGCNNVCHTPIIVINPLCRVLLLFRGIRGQNILRELLGPLIVEFLKKKDLVLNTSPVDVYKAWINHMESETGEKS